MIEILIVEDEKPISDLIRLNLMKAGYSCTCAFDGMEAADILEERNFDLIILDVMLMCGKVTNDNLIDSSHYFRNTDQYEKLMWGFSYISFCLSKHFWESDVFVSFLLTASL